MPTLKLSVNAVKVMLLVVRAAALVKTVLAIVTLNVVTLASKSPLYNKLSVTLVEELLVTEPIVTPEGALFNVKSVLVGVALKVSLVISSCNVAPFKLSSANGPVIFATGEDPANVERVVVPLKVVSVLAPLRAFT